MKYLIIFFVLFSNIISAQINPKNYPATDGMGRKLPEYKDVGPPKKGKYVGLFYWVWHDTYSNAVALNVSEILKKHPEAIYDFDNPAWRPLEGGFFFWGEPLFGYYKDTDPWVLRKHAEMLADAGVDVIILDATNGETFKECYMELFKVLSHARHDGVNTPKVAFFLPFANTNEARSEIKQLYNELYKPELYKDLWFYWKGKPLIMAYPELVSEDDQTGLNSEIKNFFSFRPGQELYNKGSERSDQWGWLEIYPQHGFGDKGGKGCEEVAVGVAQNWSKESGLTAMNSPYVFGRSYTALNGMHNNYDAVNYGYNFQEQWNQALKLNPEFIFITGWNEWIAGRYKSWKNQANAFPDEFNEERSRDIEPMKGGHADNYYYQMISNIRRFKGVPKPEYTFGMAKKNNLKGFCVNWSKVTPNYTSYKGNTLHRNFDGWKGLHYMNNTGRNDIIAAKVAIDKQFIYFYVSTLAKLSPTTGKAWMRLFINTDRNHETGWNGYDFVVNRINPDKKAFLEKSIKNWKWSQVADVDYQVKGNALEIKIPRNLLNQKGPVDFEFKWSDNMQNTEDITDFLIDGDVAPSGRFNYWYHNSDR